MTKLLTELLRQEDKLLHCVSCGFCLPACPTYSRLGDEADSPRGRLRFMRAVVEGRLAPDSSAFARHLDRCLGCRSCESVCPSGVEYGHLLEGAREVLAQGNRAGVLERTLSRILATPSFFRPSMFLTRILRGTGFPRLAAQRLPRDGILGQFRLGMGMVAATRKPERLGTPVVGRRRVESRAAGAGVSQVPKGEGRPGAGTDHGTLGSGTSVAILLGCVQEGLLSRINRATVRVLSVNGFKVKAVPGQGCCGAVHAHTGDLEGARALARKNIEAFERCRPEILAVNAAGCGAVVKDYGRLLAEDPEYAARAASLSSNTRDVTELLGRPGLIRGAPVPLRATYDAPCHLLHAQRISDEPLFLLGSIPGIHLVPLEKAEECCGGAGVYGITHPGLGGAIGNDKVSAVLDTGADVVATGNPGCLMQIGAGLQMEGRRVDVVHPVELLDESYRRAGRYGGK